MHTCFKEDKVSAFTRANSSMQTLVLLDASKCTPQRVS